MDDTNYTDSDLVGAHTDHSGTPSTCGVGVHQGLPGNYHTRDVIAGELFGEDGEVGDRTGADDGAATDETATGVTVTSVTATSGTTTEEGREASDRAPYETPERRGETDPDYYEPDDDDPLAGADILTGPAAEE